MNLYADLFLTFARIGVCTFGGGYAMLPILQREVVEKKGWATDGELTDYFAIGQCTPGVIAVNTATFVGQKQKGIPGGVAATLGLVFPSIVVIIVIAGFLQKFRQSKTVDAVFYGLRPASTALIASAGLTVATAVLITVGGLEEHLFTVHWPALLLAVAVFVCLRYTKLKKLHPIVFIGISALVGAVFRF